MQQLKFAVEGSQGDIYNIVFTRTDNNLSATCTCAAGMSGQSCKHRFALMNGDVSSLISGNEDDVSRLPSMIQDTDVARLYHEYLDAERASAELAAQLKRIKKALAKAMHR